MERTHLFIKKFFNLGQITDVVWIQTGFIGDIVLTTAAISTLKKVAPGIRQHMITTGVGDALLAGHPDLASIHVFAKRDGWIAPVLKTRKSIRSLTPKSTVILQPHKSARSTFLSLSLGYPLITFDETMGSTLAAATTPRVATLHETDRVALLLECLGLPRESILGHRTSLANHAPLTGDLQLSPDKKWIAIAPGSVWATKRWPVERYASLATRILDHSDLGIVLLGSKDEARACEFIENACVRERPGSESRIRNLAGKTTLRQLSAIFPRLSKLICNDSSPVHFASAFNIPTVAIFGATTAAMGFGPLADGSEVIEEDLPCRPCSDHGPSKCPLEHFRCMRQITVDRVFDALKISGVR